MRHRHINNRHTFGMLLNRQMMKDGLACEMGSTLGHLDENVTLETAKRRQALRYGIPSSYWRLRHHHGYVISRPL